MELEFQKVVERFATPLYRLAYSYCGAHADAEDVVQEVFLKYLRDPPSCDDEQKLRAWLMTVTANKCKDLLRASWRQSKLLDAADAPEPPPNDDRLDVQAALLRLAPMYRGVVYLYYYEELSTAQIAQILRLSQSAVKSRLYQARKQLKKLLGDDSNG